MDGSLTKKSANLTPGGASNDVDGKKGVAHQPAEARAAGHQQNIDTDLAANLGGQQPSADAAKDRPPEDRLEGIKK